MKRWTDEEIKNDKTIKIGADQYGVEDDTKDDDKKDQDKDKDKTDTNGDKTDN